MSWITRIVLYLKGLWAKWFSPTYGTETVEDELPADLHPCTLYLLRDDGFLEQAAMMCPCGCSNIIHLNLLPDERPCWRVTEHDDGTATLYPSIWRKKDCRSHFWFRKGRIIWCADTTIIGGPHDDRLHL